jgi:predicted DNA-binding transcriptional regulator AlpA
MNSGSRKNSQRKRGRSVEALATVEDDGGAERLLGRFIVAQRLDCDPSTLARMVKEGRFISPLMLGNMPRWRERDVNAWIAERASQARAIEASAAKSLEPVKRSRRGD